VLPEPRGNYIDGIQKATARAQEADLERQAQAQAKFSPLFDRSALGFREGEERGEFESR
jgi:hypothetical protein